MNKCRVAVKTGKKKLKTTTQRIPKVGGETSKGKLHHGFALSIPKFLTHEYVVKFTRFARTPA